MSLLRRMRRDLTRINTPTKEKQICRALQTIFHDMQVGLTDKEAFKILDLDYTSKEELFEVYDKDKITVNAHKDYNSMIFNNNDEILDDVQGAIVYNLDITE